MHVHPAAGYKRWYLPYAVAFVPGLAVCIAACDAGDSTATARDSDGSPAAGGTGGHRDAAAGAGGVDSSRVPTKSPSFRKIVLTTTFYAEGACYGDFDRNGTTDVMSGPYWYEGPSFTAKHPVYTATAFDPHGYSDNFLEFARDFDSDGYPDVLIVNYPGKDAAIYVNSKNPEVPWVRHSVFSAVSVESPAFIDVTGDGNPELVFAYGNRLGWAGPSSTAPLQPWVFHGASAVGSYPVFTHGLGVGDLNRDGRLDLLEMGGGWLQPASLTGDPTWTKMTATFGSGGAQMFAYDVDGDGDNDVITSLAAHDYGIAWFEHSTNAGASTFVEHIVATNDPNDAGNSPLIHQPHALDLRDMNGDGLSDIVTGERFWGHVPAGNPDVNAPASLYWFALERTPGGVRFTPHLVDSASGVGTQVVAADVNDDGLVDILTGSKKGAFVFLQE
jgi:hypothetical protein